MDIICLNASRVKRGTPPFKVYKDECYFSFDSAESDPNGLFICMETFLGFGRRFVHDYYKKTGRQLFMLLKRTKLFKENATIPEKVSRLAIGVEGGFNPNEKKFEWLESWSVVVLPSFEEFALDVDGMPQEVKQCGEAIMIAESASSTDEVESNIMWDGEQLQISKYSDSLIQLDNGVKIGPKGWKCADCNLTNNLWLNLTDGSIKCGRRYFDGSGGNNHAIQHYEATKYPLAVKLGSINATKADVMSYAEDSMVIDTNLERHLAHFGININSLQKTDKSMIELEIDMNERIGEWTTLCESGSVLIPVYGPGNTGMKNLGNTCYMNSVVQVLFHVAPFQRRYVERAKENFEAVNFDRNGGEDFLLQMTKLGTGLLSGRYSQPPPNDGEGIAPRMFKALIGRGHPEFSGKQQCDAQEFLLHLLTTMERYHEHQAVPVETSPGDCFKFMVQDRIQCLTSNKVRYMSYTKNFIPLPIPLDSIATFKGESSLPRIDFEECLAAFRNEDIIDDFYSSSIGTKTKATKRFRLQTFPDYLIIQLEKFRYDNNWKPSKLDVEIVMPQLIDLESLRSPGGIQPGEVELSPDEDDHRSMIVPDAGMVDRLVEMGFSLNSSKRALVETSNSGFEAAMNWIMDHMDDPDFDRPLIQANTKKTVVKPSAENVACVMTMGFTADQARKALEETEDNVNRALDWIFSHPLGEKIEDSTVPNCSLSDGGSRYRLKAFISHMGTSVMVGHYVCHVFKEGKWVIFNDEKVALSENPPINRGYIYLYERC